MPNPSHQAHNPEVVELDASAPIEEIVNVINRDGGIIIKNFLSPETIDKIQEESQPYWSKLGTYCGKLFDAADPPLSGFAGKSPTFAHKAINHPTYREVAKALLKEESNVYRDGKRYNTVSYPVLAVSEAFNRGSPSTAQQLHRDDMAQHFDHLEGSGESSLLGLLVAGVDTNFENGATQVIVGSHKWPEAAVRGPADRSLCSTCEMNKGDAVFIIGSIWHGAGENKTNPPERRIIYSCHMTRGSMRADENQYLGIDLDVIKTYEPEVQALLGYSISQPNCGHLDGKDPITLLGSKEDPFGYGSLPSRIAT
ncbi:hypothetical protein ASPVEDRAFT_81185 [Aspergillus versicolor CBS 583.65]|uniref:PhyH-domain-containing protein n=1 Tax=Aspergillus versicolor CBS 583.65 TaxID=1036611 RepID=A0A1L9PDK7_ASPVE|nr:uncharacterized protein ASPVEDRAFT_81185 [Aspergillus versicolor CBS 583.65]OJI99578.1 hypothetical protein ASPVEDRAFT_81185 [Aspergillus versicolor CBS 583.65]